MKKHNLYFMLTVLLAGLFASCSQEDMDGPQTNEPTGVTLSASVDRSIQTRAGTILDKYKLRYILEVWTTGDSPELKYREEQIKADFSGVDFTFGLTDAGNYNALLWADFLLNENTSTTSKETISEVEYDHYPDNNYKTTDNLKNITLDLAGNVPYQALDAFCACHPISKTTGAYSGNVQLVRPFGQINIIEKDKDALAKVNKTKAVFKVPEGYNIESGMPTSTTKEVERSMIKMMWDATFHDCTANLYYDYIFAPSTGQTTLGEIALSFEAPYGETSYQIADFTIPANMPVVRNKRTNISGHIVSVSDASNSEANLSVTVSDGWSNDQIEEDTDVALARKILDLVKESGNSDDATAYKYSIATAEQMAALSTLANADAVITGCTTAKYRNANYKLIQNIDLKKEPWTPIDNFSGTFDGQGYTISNMNVSITSQSTSTTIYGGLFAVLFGTVSNLIVEGEVTVNGAGHCYAGGICGWHTGDDIKFCRFNGTVSSTTTGNTRNYAGGITGTYSGTPTITGCIANAKATVSGGDASNSGAGGLAGRIIGRNCIYSAWNNDSNSGGTSNMIASNAGSDSGTGTGNNSFTTISGLNALLNGINDGVSESTYVWQAGSTGTDYPILVKRTSASN